jgi:hypothetical protein
MIVLAPSGMPDSVPARFCLKPVAAGSVEAVAARPAGVAAVPMSSVLVVPALNAVSIVTSQPSGMVPASSAPIGTPLVAVTPGASANGVSNETVRRRYMMPVSSGGTTGFNQNRLVAMC